MDVSFDDLIPSGAGAPAAAGSDVSFDDLVPKGALGLQTRTQSPGKLLGPAIPMLSDEGGMNGPTSQAWYKDAAGQLQPTNDAKHIVSGGNVYEKTDGVRPTTGGDLAQAGKDALGSVPLLGSAIALTPKFMGGGGAAEDFWSGQPGSTAHMSDVLTGLMGPGPVGALRPSTRGLTTSPPENPSVTTGGLRAAGADPSTVAKVQMLEQAQLGAKSSGNPLNQSLRDQSQGILLDDKRRGMLSQDTQDALQGFVDQGASTKTNTAAKGWGMGMGAGLLAERIPYVGKAVGGSVMAGSVAAKALRKLSDNRATSAFEQIKADAAAEPPPVQPVAPPIPPVSNPTGPQVPRPATPWGAVPPEPPPLDPGAATTTAKVNAWMKMATDLANQKGKAPTGPAADLLGGQSLDQVLQPPAAPAPTPPPTINPLALPTSITTPAKNIMGGLADVQTMQAKSNPLAKYEDAVRMNAGIDRANSSALTKDATGLMAARKAAAAAEEANAEPQDPTQPQPPPVAPPAPPVIAKLSKKAGGPVKETPAPQAEAPPTAPDAPVELPQSDYSHLPRAAAAKLITDRVFAAGKKISVTPEEYQAGVHEKLTAKESIADDMAKAMPEVEHQDINAHLQGAKTKAQAALVADHYIKLHPEAEAAIRLAFAKKKLNAGWTR